MGNSCSGAARYRRRLPSYLEEEVFEYDGHAGTTVKAGFTTHNHLSNGPSSRLLNGKNKARGKKARGRKGQSKDVTVTMQNSTVFQNVSANKNKFGSENIGFTGSKGSFATTNRRVTESFRRTGSGRQYTVSTPLRSHGVRRSSRGRNHSLVRSDGALNRPTRSGLNRASLRRTRDVVFIIKTDPSLAPWSPQTTDVGESDEAVFVEDGATEAAKLTDSPVKEGKREFESVQGSLENGEYGASEAPNSSRTVAKTENVASDKALSENESSLTTLRIASELHVTDTAHPAPPGVNGVNRASSFHKSHDVAPNGRQLDHDDVTTFSETKQRPVRHSSKSNRSSVNIRGQVTRRSSHRHKVKFRTGD